MQINNDLNTFFGYSKPRQLIPARVLEAPGTSFDRDTPMGRFSVCLGVCHDGRRCPFSNCGASSANFGASSFATESAIAPTVH